MRNTAVASCTAGGESTHTYSQSRTHPDTERHTGIPLRPYLQQEKRAYGALALDYTHYYYCTHARAHARAHTHIHAHAHTQRKIHTHTHTHVNYYDCVHTQEND